MQTTGLQQRIRIQRQATDLLIKNKRLICEWATSVGKTKVALNYVKDNPSDSVLILVPETDNIRNWETEFSDFSIPRNNVVIACYASFHKFSSTQWDLIVFDEAPHVDTEKRKAVCKSISGKHILALGAVLSEEEVNTLQTVYGNFYRWRISFDQAIDLGILPEPIVWILHMDMNKRTGKRYYDRSIRTEKEIYDLIQKKVDDAVSAYNDNPSAFNKQKMLRAGRDRKVFLASMKTAALKYICGKLDEKNRRYICFCNSISQAEKIGGDRAYTSKTPVSAKRLEMFNNGDINALFVVGKLIEGQNLKNIECGIIGQLGGKERITVQSIGRIMRAENPVVYIPVFDDSKDDGFLYNVTCNIPDKYIKHYKL